MFGSRSGVRALALAFVVLTGVALATPVAVLRLDPGGHVYQLAEGERYEYSYQQSIYQVRVIEEHVRAGDALEIRRVRSRDLRAVEYFRWDGGIRRDGDEFVQDAPANRVAALTIRITREGAQRLRGERFDLSLRAQFDEIVLRVRPEHVPALLAWIGRALP